MDVVTEPAPVSRKSLASLVARDWDSLFLRPRCGFAVISVLGMVVFVRAAFGRFRVLRVAFAGWWSCISTSISMGDEVATELAEVLAAYE